MRIARHIPAAAAIGVLAACVQTPPDLSIAGRGLNVTGVEVSVLPGAAVGDSVVTGRQIGVDAAQFNADLDAALTQAFVEASDPAGEEVNVQVTVSEAYLAPPVERAIAGTSYIIGTVTLTDADGIQLVPSAEVQGNSDNIRLAGLAGVLTSQTIAEDYRGTLRGFAKTVRNAIFGDPDDA